MKKLALFLLAAFLIMKPSDSLAQLMVEQGKVELNVQPGQSITGEITIHNSSKTDTVDIVAYWEDFMYVPPYTGEKEFTPAGSSSYSMASWINFTPREFALEPLGQRQIRFTLHVPQDAEGGRYGVLFFETETDQVEGNVGMNIIARLGSLFFVEVGNPARNADLVALTLENNMLSATMKNTSSIILIPEGSYFIMDEEGLVIDRERIEPVYLAPGAEAPIKFPLAKDLKSGDYHLVITFDLGGGKSLVKEIDFEKASDSSLKLRPASE